MTLRYVLWAAAAVLLVAAPAQAQMFGPRALGNTLSRRVGPGDAFSPLNDNLGAQGDVFSQFGQGGTLGAQPPGGAGQLSGNERYLRGNRGAGSFVGTDARDRRRFVGRLQTGATAAIRSATTAVRPPTTPSANQPQTAASARRSGPYDPRLSVDFEFTVPPADSVSLELTRRLLESPAIQRHGPLEVSVAGQTAILRGEVASERDRVLAGNLVALEPGIWRVQNDLTTPGRERPAAPRPLPPPLAVPPP